MFLMEVAPLCLDEDVSGGGGDGDGGDGSNGGSGGGGEWK